MLEDKALSNLYMDRSEPLGNSVMLDGRRALHVRTYDGIIGGIQYDAMRIDHDTSTTESYHYLQGGLLGTIVASVRITYESASKNYIVSMERF